MKEHFIGIFHECKELIFDPHKKWPTLNSQTITYQEFFRRFLIPVIGLIGVANILGDLLYGSRFGVVYSYILTHAVGEMAVYFFSVVGIAYLINELGSGFGLEHDFDHTVRFVGYSMVPAFAMSILLGIFPGLDVLGILSFYSLYLFVIGIPYFFPAFSALSRNRQHNFIISAILLGILFFLLVFYLLRSILSA